MHDLVIRNGRVLIEGTFQNTDVGIRGDTIYNIGENLHGKRVIDGTGKLIYPGAIDAHVHFREPGNTHKETFATGSRAAVFGGVTTIFEMPNTTPTTTTVEEWHNKESIAIETSYCNFGLFFGATPSNISEALAAPPTPGLKIFMGCSTGDLLVHKMEDLEPIFRDYPNRICVHAELEDRLNERKAAFRDQTDTAIHSEIRDVECAVLAIKRAGELAAKYGRHLHVLHLSSRGELDAIAEIRASEIFKKTGAKITCEVCPHHLFFDTQDYAELGNFVKMNPPLRDASDREEMWQALKRGEIQMVATDHAPHVVEEKNRPYWDAPSGVPAVELMFPLLLDAAHRGLCTYEEVGQWVCHGPAEVYKIPKRGFVKTGFVADLTIVDPSQVRNITNESQRTKCAWTPWVGRSNTGWPVVTIVNGQVVMENDEVASLAIGRNVLRAE